MTREEFQDLVSQLVRAYGDRAYPEERISRLWNRLQYIHPKIAQNAIDNLIADNLQPPLMTKILEACHAQKKLFPSLDQDPYSQIRDHLRQMQNDKQLCDKCWNLGVLTAYRKDRFGNPSEEFLCTCPSGQIAGKLPENKILPEWLHYYKTYYVLHSDPNGTEELQKVSHILNLPVEERLKALVKLSLNDPRS